MNDCGVEKTARILGSKWTILILRELCEEKKRFGELQFLLKGISPKTLSIRLKELEKYEIVRKKVFPVIPLHVEYSLTPKGKSIREIILKMCEWGKKTKLPDSSTSYIHSTT
jgi:DNA-binding HxlR family transcriptional regulator